jgi:hypothetical protein
MTTDEEREESIARMESFIRDCHPGRYIPFPGTKESTMSLTIREWQAAYDRSDPENAFDCLARDYQTSGPGMASMWLHDSIKSRDMADLIASDCRRIMGIIGPKDEDYPRFVTLLQLCEEYPES